MKTLKNLAALALILGAVATLLIVLPGCVSMEAPKSFNDRLAYGYASVAAVRDTAASLLERKRISIEDAKQVQALADQARTALDLARGNALKGDLKTAEGQLTLALDVLTRVETFLRAKEAS